MCKLVLAQYGLNVPLPGSVIYLFICIFVVIYFLCYLPIDLFSYFYLIMICVRVEAMVQLLA